MPDSVAENADLERLYICELGLTEAPGWLGALTRLRTLDLGHNRLSAVPDLSPLVELEILYLHDNALRSLPPLPASLSYLNVSENPLGELPGALGKLSALIELRALDLGLTALPGALSGLSALRELHLRANALAEVPPVVRELRELRLLDLRMNRLRAVPDWLVELPRLEKLDLRWNDVYEPPPGLRERGCVVLTE